MKIAIKFINNDFGNTFLGVLQTLLNAYRHTGMLPPSKSELTFMINSLSAPCYVLFQNEKITHNMTEYIHTKEYLQIEEKDLLIDKEVDEYSLLTGHHNHSTFVLDTDLDYEDNSPIYFL